MKNYLSITGLALQHSKLGSESELFSHYINSACRSDSALLLDCCSRKIPALADLLPDLRLRRVPQASKMALHTAALALYNAGLSMPFKEKESLKTGVYIGSGHGPVKSNFDFNDSILDDGLELSSPTAFSHSVNNIYAALIAINLNIKGPNLTCTQFGLSTAGALQAASCALLSGEIDLALLGSVEEANSILQAAYQAAHKGSYSLDENFIYPEVCKENCFVFFCLQRANVSKFSIHLSNPFWAKFDQESNKQEKETTLFLRSGYLKKDKEIAQSQLNSQEQIESQAQQNLRQSLYGHSPAAHALDMALAVYLLKNNFNLNKAGSIKSIVCEMQDPVTNCYAAVQLVKSP